MKRSQFKKPTPQKLKELQERKREKAMAKIHAPKSLKRPLGASRKPKRTRKRLKDGSLAKSEQVRILKKKLWSTFSQYIRKREADHTGWLITVDGERALWKECDCGHLWHNSERNALLGGNELWYYENNFAPQSNQGNRLNADDSAQKYMLAATQKYGADEILKMRRMKEQYKLWTFEELTAKYEHYKALLEAL